MSISKIEMNNNNNQQYSAQNSNDQPQQSSLGGIGKTKDGKYNLTQAKRVVNLARENYAKFRVIVKFAQFKYGSPFQVNGAFYYGRNNSKSLNLPQSLVFSNKTLDILGMQCNALTQSLLERKKKSSSNMTVSVLDNNLFQVYDNAMGPNSPLARRTDKIGELVRKLYFVNRQLGYRDVDATGITQYAPVITLSYIVRYAYGEKSGAKHKKSQMWDPINTWYQGYKAESLQKYQQARQELANAINNQQAFAQIESAVQNQLRYNNYLKTEKKLAEEISDQLKKFMQRYYPAINPELLSAYKRTARNLSDDEYMGGSSFFALKGALAYSSKPETQGMVQQLVGNRSYAYELITGKLSPEESELAKRYNEDLKNNEANDYFLSPQMQQDLLNRENDKLALLVVTLHDALVIKKINTLLREQKDERVEQQNSQVSDGNMFIQPQPQNNQSQSQQLMTPQPPQVSQTNQSASTSPRVQPSQSSPVNQQFQPPQVSPISQSGASNSTATSPRPGPEQRNNTGNVIPSSTSNVRSTYTPNDTSSNGNGSNPGAIGNLFQ
jgi:hypothetical protein